MRRACLIIALATLVSPLAYADGGFRLSSGKSIDLPTVAGLDCPAMSNKLSEIDGTGYREGGPTPRNVADLPLLEYEEELATAFYRSCVISALSQKAPSTAFAEWYRGKN